MGFYDDRVDNLNIESKIQDCRESIQKIENESDLETDYELFEHLERFKATLNLAESNFKGSDIFLTPFNVYTNINSYITSISSQISNYHNSGNNNNKNTAVDQCDKLLSQIRLLAVPRSTEELEALSENIRSTRMSISQHKRYALEESGNITEKKDEVVGLAETISEIESEVETEKEEFIRNHEETLEELSTDFHDGFSEMIEQEQEIVKNKMKSYMDEFLDYYNATRIRLERKQTKLEELFSFVTDNSISGEFHKAAEEEKGSWKSWSIITLSLFIIAIIYSLLAFLTSEITSWIDIGKRISITFGIFAFAAYAAKQASDHKREARENRSIQMKIQSINPFLENYDDESEEIKEIKKQLADHIFTQEIAITQETNKRESKAEQNPTLKLKDIMSLLKELKK
ncbi:hypothetical protein [Thalassobacillus sp. CUG 92003]|uniref:hypothetical protein n=1 Tax=Thalassobacillus sp. CUG 92003 TaxID=2736641 RepID=UPI0015E6724B|nr:hypothetical protein [Thalassobacillus sp. CUG 92003]